MAEQTVSLAPGESKAVSFEATPAVAKTYQVSVDGLTGSFRATEAPVEVIDFELAMPTVSPAEITPGTAITITCPVTSACTKTQTITAKVIIYEGSILPGHGAIIATKTSPSFSISPGEAYNVIVHHTAVAGTIDRRDIEVEIYIASTLVKESEWDDIYYVEKPALPEVVVEFDKITVLNIEGIPFSDVIVEDTIGNMSVAKLAACIAEKYSYIGEWAQTGAGIKYPGAAAQHVGPCPWIRGADSGMLSRELAARLLAMCEAHPEYLFPFELEINPGTGNLWYKDHVMAWASGCMNAWYPDAWGGPPLSQFQTATLSQPIVVDKIRGITLTVQGKPPTPTAPTNMAGINTINTLQLEPQFSAPMPPPEFRGSGEILADIERNIYGVIISLTFVPCEITANSLYTAGHYYPGIYDGVVSITWYSPWGGAPTYSFRIKNLMRVTGEGVV